MNGRSSKYNNVRVRSDGYTFDSKAEAARYEQLKLMEQAGRISDLRVHPTYELQPRTVRPNGLILRPITYEADFAYTSRGRQIVEDVKGVETDVFKLKAKMFRYHYPDLDLRILPVSVRSHGRPKGSTKRRKAA